MKWIKENLTKWWLWAIVTAVFLFVVQVLFRIKAPCKWLDAVWSAGDLLSLAGTLVLGYVAVLQTQRANDMASDANKTSRKLIELQKAEYTPVVIIDSFAGITKHALAHENIAACSEIIVHEMRCTNGEVLVGHSVSLMDEHCDASKYMYCRDYEIHLNYSGRFVVESFQIKEIRFVGNDFERVFDIRNTMDMSLGQNERFKLFLFLFSNDNFLVTNSASHQYLGASFIILKVEMKSIDGKTYNETIKIRKLLVNDPDPELELDNAELLVSASYQVHEE